MYTTPQQNISAYESRIRALCENFGRDFKFSRKSLKNVETTIIQHKGFIMLSIVKTKKGNTVLIIGSNHIKGAKFINAQLTLSQTPFRLGYDMATHEFLVHDYSNGGRVCHTVDPVNGVQLEYTKDWTSPVNIDM